MIRVPIIETERLRLRGPRLSDFGPLAAFFASPHSILVGGPKTRLQAFQVLLNMRLHWLRHGFGYWQITLKSTGQPIGATGSAMHPGADDPELGLFVYKEFESEGYGSEAVVAGREYTFRHLGVERIVSYINPDNSRAVFMAKHFGATFEGETVVGGYSCHLYLHPSPLAADNGAAPDTAKPRETGGQDVE